MVIEAAVKVVGSTRPEGLFEKTTLLKGSHFAKEVENSRRVEMCPKRIDSTRKIDALKLFRSRTLCNVVKQRRPVVMQITRKLLKAARN